MAIGERIRFFRNLRGMTQKYLGQLIGFSAATADIRMAQYEAGKRTPKADMIEKLAGYLGVAPEALTVPDTDNDYELMHALFVLEDKHRLTISSVDGEPCLRVGRDKYGKRDRIYDRLRQWLDEAEKLERGEITKEEYDRWRYTYPEVEAERTRAALDKLRAEEKAKQAEKEQK